MAHSGHAGQRVPRQLSGVKRTRPPSAGAAANDPKRTSACDLVFRRGRALFEGRRDGRERRFEVGAEARDYRDDRERNPRSDETIFNGRSR